METINNLIQQTKEEIEEIEQHYDFDVKWFENPSSNNEKRNILKAKLSTLQTARDIFLKMLDDRIKELKDDDLDSEIDELEEIKQKLLGEKDGNNK